MPSLEEENAFLKRTVEELRQENAYIKERSRVYFNNSDLSYVVLDAHQMIVDVNDIFENLFGYAKKEILGEHFSKIFTTPQLYDTWCANYVQYNALDNVSNLEFRLQKKSKVIFWAELFGRNYEDNGALFSIWSIRDISLRVRSRNTIRNLNIKLQKQFEELQEILDVIPLPIFIKDKQFRYIGCNKAMCSFFEIDKMMILGKMVFDLFPYELASAYHEKDKEMPQVSYQTYKISLQSYVSKKELTLEIHKKRILREGEFDGFVGVLIDVTEKEKQEQYLQQRIEEEVKRNLSIQALHQEEMIRNAKFSSIGQMAAGITHEINTPLTYVKGNFEMLLEDMLGFVPESVKEEMLHDGKIIQEGLERIESIINTMREASQKSAEKQEHVNVYETIISALILSHNRAKQIVQVMLNQKPFHMGMAKDEMNIGILGQKQRIEQVWIIVLNNALDELIKIEDFHHRALHVNVSLMDDEVLISFWDNAGGIDTKILPRIFEPFESTKESSGIGIGLNIAHGIVSQNGGKIEAYNYQGGALFEVRFPLMTQEHENGI